METLLDVGVALLRLVPLVLAFYIPALVGTVIWSEGGEGYRIKALVWFAAGFGAVAALQVLFTGASGLELAAILGLSAVQVGVALGLAALTVYRLSARASL